MSTGNEIAIIGLAGRFPGAANADAFWRNLRDGVESVTFFDADELESSALVPSAARQQAGFVPAGGVLADADRFDHDLFGLSPREARWMDPQQRVFLELAWAALEDAGYDPGRYPGRISVYAGAGTTGHLLSVLGEAGSDPASLYEALSGDNLATRVSFGLGLRGESVTVHTACSTGLAVVHLAAQSLLLGQSGIALAGAARIAVPQQTGYVYADGMILSPDGHCRAFDHRAAGTVSGNGAGVVVLKPLADAVADGDRIYAVLEGSAMNNEGHRGVGYTAPSVAGQAEVITEALAFAGVSGEQIGYVEAHGTGTPLGDPIEIAALTRAFRQTGGSAAADCLIGSVKTNIGHLDTAAGIAGLIKVALMLRHGEIPPSLHLEKPNPAIAFDDSPFAVSTALRRWERDGTPRRAGISSFGIGGTNVHAVLAEAPPAASPGSTRPHQLVTLAAHTPSALTAMAAELADHVAGSEVTLADVAYTRAVGRAPLRYRRGVVAADLPELVGALRSDPGGGPPAEGEPRVALLFPGQGSAWHAMAAELYAAEPAFAAELDRCLAEVEPRLGRALLPVLLEGSGPIDDAELAHAAIFAVEVALARLWIGWGVRPAALLGHSYGEYAAACVAGVYSLADAAELALIRGRLVAGLPEGGMLAVGLTEDQLEPYLKRTGLSLAAVNGAGRCVVSGPTDGLSAVRKELDAAGQPSVPLPVRYAFHSPAVEPIMAELAAAAERFDRLEPALPLVSSLTGDWWAESADHWSRQLREPVRFAAGLDTVAGSDEDPLVLIEVGADQALTSLARSHLRGRAQALPSLRRQAGDGSDHRVLLESAGAAWSAGVPIDWEAFYRPERRHRVDLPTYPFEGAEHRIAAGVTSVATVAERVPEPVPPAIGGEQAAPSGDGPRDEVERRVFEIWRDRLGRDDFGIHDNFLELGGNSLTAAQVLTRLRDAFGIPIPLSALFEAPTVAGAAERIRAIQAGAAPGQSQAGSTQAAQLPPIVPVPRDRELPLSVVQARTLAMEAADPGNPQLVMPAAIELTGELDTGALERAIEAVVRRHETLRTTFHGSPDWVQRVEPDGRVALETEDLTGAGDPGGRAQQLAREEPGRPFDLSVSPCRARLLRLAADRHVLLVTIHHVVCDTWSLANLMGEIAAGYRALVSTGRPAELPALEVQYADFAGWQRTALDGGALAGQVEHWRRRLAGSTPLAIPDLAPAAAGFRGHKVPVALSAELSEQVTEAGRKAGSTGFVTLLAAYSVVLGRLADTEDVVIGTPIGNRDRVGLEPLIGYVAHAIGLRADLSGDPTFADLVGRLQQTLMSAYADPDVPYEAIVDEVDPARAGGRMFDALMVVHSGIAAGMDVPGGRWSLWEVPEMPAMFGPTMSRLSLMLVDSADGFAGAMEYADGVDPGAARRIFDQIAEVLADAVARPQARISTLARPASSSTIPQLSLSYFANDEDALQGPKYRLLLEGAKLADRLGFTAIWTPERHFHPFGGLYPSPTAINAGLATVTERIGLRAGSVVLPLHDPIRVAEEWSVIDNLSGGRAGVSFASGWNVNDFVLAPDAYADRRDMHEGIDAVRRLWRGDAITRRNGIGEEVEVRIRPRPVQAELPFWVTAAGSPATFQLAGELGGYVLTNLMGQTLDALAGKLDAYRKAWRDAGHGPGDGHVTLMLHAFVADDTATAYQQARQPLLDYFRSSVDIIRGLIAGQGLDIKTDDLSEDDLQTLLEHGLARYLRDGGLFGTAADCLPMLERVRAIGVDEVAALIDFGVPIEETLHSVELLGGLLQPAERPLPLSFAQQRLWYLEQLTPQNIAYNNHVALRLRGKVDPGALQHALQEVVRRHDVLRTTFPGTDDGAVQVVAPELTIELPVEDATEAEIADRARAHVHAPIDLAAGPLLRTTLLRLADDDHVLLVTMHHIVSDGWSAGVLLTELGALYTGAGALLPELSWQYADYAVWQREVLASGALDGELEYWKSNLAGVPMLDLPADRPRGGVQGHAGARCPVRLDRSGTDALHALCRRAGVTPYMVLHAGLTALLHRYSGQTDLAIGTAVAGRNRPETEPLVGCFVNSVVIRTDLSGDPAFGELLGRVKDSTLGALAHAELPFERLVDELKVPRSLSQSPLFQAMLVLHNTPSPRVELGELTLEPVPVDTGLSKLDLMLELREEPDGIAGSFEYNTDLFDAGTIEQLAQYLQELLSQATIDPDRRLSELELASGRIAELTAGAPLTPRPGEALSEHETVDAILAAQAELAPDAPAVGELSYRELWQQATRIAHGLREHGVGPGRLAGLLIEDPGLAIVAMAGVLIAGGGYVPLDPKAPRARNETMTREADPVLLLTDGAAGELAGKPVLPVGALAGRTADPVPRTATPADVAYVIFTSGSTGKPKGVVVEHRHLVYSTRARRELAGPGGTCLSLQPMTFDPSIGWIWYALLTGGTIWRARPDVVAEPLAVADLIEGRGVTHLGAVPALYGALLAAAPERLGSLRVVLIGGESLPPELIRAHSEALPAAELHNFYGPAEATVFCTACRVDGHRTGRVPIGRPSPGGQGHVLDEHRRPVPVGAIGELYVGGPGVARGYLGAPELTAERFVEIDGNRLYRTGDRVRWNRHGLLEFLGRVDRQVKIRGMRVEPGEVEAVLAGHPGVAEAAVIPAGGRLVGYLALRDGTTADAVRANAADQLPDYLVPAQLVAVDALPRTAHGKVDVAALPEPPADARTGGTAPRDPRESVLAGIVAAVLGLPAVDVHDNFYELGGDSILAISVVTRARREGIELTVRQLVQSPTVAGLAAIAGTRLARPADQSTVAGPVPLTPIQRWFFDLDLSAPWHWNEAVQLEFTEPVREDLLQEAFRAVLHHHDALRLRFSRRAGRWSAVSVPAEADWRLGRIELDQADDFQADCDLASGPLLRAAMIGSDRLLVVAHHLVTDGVSWRILLTDLFAAYRALVAGLPIDLPPKTTSYAEWSRRLAEYTPSAAELEHWNSLDTGRAAPLPRGTGERAVVRVELDTDRTQQVLRAGALDVLLTATAAALANWTGGDHVLLDLGHHGREDLVEGLDVVRTVGWFSGFHPVLLPVPDASPAERLRAVREHLRSVPANGAGFIPSLVAGLVDVPPAEVHFTYLGQLDAALPARAPARILDEIPGRLRADGERRRLEITAGVLDRRLWLAFSTDGSYPRDSLTTLAEAVTGLIDRLV